MEHLNEMKEMGEAFKIGKRGVQGALKKIDRKCCNGYYS